MLNQSYLFFKNLKFKNLISYNVYVVKNKQTSSWTKLSPSLLRPNKLSQKSLFTTTFHNNCKKKQDNMPCILNVAEKNDAAKNLADIMSRGGFTRRDGFSVYNKIYEFDMVLNGEQCRMKMTSVSGHLLNFEFVGNNRKWYGCHPVDLFDAPVMKGCQENMQPIKKTLEKEIRTANKLIIWTDCDREGENIGFEIIDVCKQVKPNITVLRAKFSEITQRSVQRALQTLGPPDEKQNKAVDVRSELDLRIGAAFTRFQTLRLQKVFPATLGDSVISYGSCQFPTLGFVVERYKAIQQFIPESFWKIKVTHDGGDGLIDFLWKRVRLFDELACQVLLDQCEDNPTATVVNVITKPKSKWRPLPLDTIELEKLGSRKLKINAKETMKIAEKLYTSGLISYPRTETNIFPPELDLNPLVQIQTVDPTWGGFANQILANGPNPRRGKKSDQAHPPIHPTKHAANLHGNELKVYEFIVRHFLACLSKDAQGQETIVEIDIASERFNANGLIITERNYLEVYPYDRWSDKVMPNYVLGQTFQPTSLEMIDSQTSPPSLLTEADLIALMEKHGIGTDATHAEHIETIKSRLYVGLQDNKFVPGELGMGLVEGYDAMGFAMSKPNLRSDFEADLKRICEGTKDPSVVLREQVKKYKDVFKEAVNQANKIDEALGQLLAEAPSVQPAGANNPILPQISAVVKCSDCNTGSNIVVKMKRNGQGYFLSCQGYPHCKTVRWLPEDVISVVTLEQSCQHCSGHPKLLKFKFKPRSYAPILPDEYSGCLGGCDDQLTDTLGIQPLNQPRNTVNSRTGGNNPGDDDRGSGRVRLTQQNNRSQDNDTFHDSGLGSFNSFDSQASRFNSHNGNNSNTYNRTQGSYRPNVHQSVPPSYATNDENAIVCNCNLNACLRTVRKEGANTGRQFYGCSKPRDEGCSFFLWADENTNSPNNSQSINNNRGAFNDNRSTNNNRGAFNNNPSSFNSGSSFNSSNQIPNHDPGEIQLMCDCNQPTVRRTTQKEGPNKGRDFFVCNKPRENQCRFFKWSDEVDGETRNNTFNASSVNTFSSNFNNSGSIAKKGPAKGVKRKAPGETTKKRKCGVCGEEGHNRKNCPQNEF